MTEPPRPPGEGNPNDPTTPFNPYAANDPTSGSTPPPPPPPGGYAPPPAGGYPPPPGGASQYGSPAGGPQYGYSPQPSAQDDRTWILVNHFGGAAGAFLGGGCSGWIVPLIALLARGNQSPAVRAEAVKALNFQILWSIVGFIGLATWCIGIGFIISAVAWAIATIFGIIAGIKASNNEPYNYPLSVQIIK